jgi:uncharacterized protein (DUF362 family)
MNRRSFLKTIASAGAALGLSGVIGGFNSLTPIYAQTAFPDLVAIKGLDLKSMYEKALESIGGLGRFVKSGQTVLIKPNMAWAKDPISAANTSPELLSLLIKNSLALGAKKVSVFDNTCDNWTAAYSVSGLEAAAKDAGAVVAPANQESYYQKVTLPGATIMKEASYHELYLEADVIINVPVLKHHGGAKMTAALKNLMGVVWDRSFMHSKGLDETIAESYLYKKPNLHLVDAQRVMISGGPSGRAESRYLAAQMLLVSADPVAIDVAAAKILSQAGIPEPYYIARAAALGLGQSDLSGLNVQRLSL